jgi:pimeloyl-ACP methyl ester carboxylesterase
VGQGDQVRQYQGELILPDTVAQPGSRIGAIQLFFERREMAVEIERGLMKSRYGYLHYRAAGQGQPIVLQHINQQSSALYLEMIEALAPHMRAIAVDYPSHGMSDHVAEQPSIADYARATIAILDALGVKKTMVLGEATGAGVAVELAGACPDRVTKAVLVNCPFIEETTEQVLAPFKSDFRPSDPTGFPALRTMEFMLEKDPEHAPLQPTQSWMDRMNRAQMEVGRDRWQALTALAQFDMDAALRRVACPTLLLIGEHFYFRHKIPKIEERVRDLRVEILPDARFNAGWERATEIAAKAVAFAKG